MTDHLRSLAVIIKYLAHRLAVFMFFLAAIGLTGATILAAAGVLPWVQFTAFFGGTAYVNAGQIAQIGITVLSVLLCFYLPANLRIMKLENSHRRFDIGMEDVARAYAVAHASDRKNVFRLSSEFDAVRERLNYMRTHPELETFEPGVLEAAAQMSFISHELADIYSDDKVERAHTFLKQRQQEVEAFNARIERAKLIVQEIKYWTHEVELEETLAANQLQKLREEVQDLLPDLMISDDIVRPDGTVVAIPKAPNSDKPRPRGRARLP